MALTNLNESQVFGLLRQSSNLCKLEDFRLEEGNTCCLMTLAILTVWTTFMNFYLVPLERFIVEGLTWAALQNYSACFLEEWAEEWAREWPTLEDGLLSFFCCTCHIFLNSVAL